jgi:hypothetical protein
VVTVATISRPEELVEYLAEFIVKSKLPLEHVGMYDEMLIPGYPAVQVQSGQFTKEHHGTHTWLISMRANIYVMHARMTVDRRTRNKQDLELATELVALLEADMSLGGRVITGFVENELPDSLPLGSDKDDSVVSTRLGWFGIVERRF